MPNNAKIGINVNLQTDLWLEQQVELKELSNKLLSVKESRNLSLGMRSEEDKTVC